MSRVEITGQYNVDAPACSGSQPILVERRPVSLSTMNIPRNWNQFCDSVDEALAPLTKIRSLAKVSSILFYVFITIYVLFIVVLPPLLQDFNYGFLKYSSFVVYPFVLIYIYFICKSNRELKSCMK